MFHIKNPFFRQAGNYHYMHVVHVTAYTSQCCMTVLSVHCSIPRLTPEVMVSTKCGARSGLVWGSLTLAQIPRLTPEVMVSTKEAAEEVMEA